MAVERARPDFPLLLGRCALSVSQAGYNTVVDVLQSGARCVLVAFDAGGEREQLLRARRLEALGLAAALPQQDVSADTLLAAVTRQLAAASPQRGRVDLRGAEVCVAAIETEAARAAGRAAAWKRLGDALDRLKAQGRSLTVWWRDDDAVAPGPALDRLLELSRRYCAPLGLAVIPARAEPALAERLAADRATVDVLVHGWAHRNHAPAGAKKRELGDRPTEQVLGELAQGLEATLRLFGARAIPVLVPPWNRIDPALQPQLRSLGFRGLSTFKHRTSPSAAPGVALVNTHGDPIAWRAGGGLADEATFVVGLASHAEAMVAGEVEPWGLLTHHLAHDAWTWRFVERLLATLAAHGAVRFSTARAVFGIDSDAGRCEPGTIRTP